LHLESHREDEMAMIMNVGDYKAPLDSSWLPPGYPRCDTSFLSTKKEFPACDCYINADAVMDNALTRNHRCSRDYLCFHDKSPQSNLVSHPYKSGGIAIRSQYDVPGWAISLLIVLVTAVCSNLIAHCKSLIAKCRNDKTLTKKEGSVASIEQMNHSSVANTDHVIGQQGDIALLLINVQNEFVDRNGKLNYMVKAAIDDINAVTKTIELANIAR
jgi:hypothetical protein